MSKLVKNLKAYRTDRRYAISDRTSLVDMFMQQEANALRDFGGPAYGVELKMKLEINGHATVALNEDSGEMRDIMKRQFIEELFGEFRKPIMHIYDRLYQRDIEGAILGLKNLEELIFTEKEV